MIPAMMIAAAVLAIVVSTPVQEKDFAPPNRTLDVYERVLRFYRPPAGQSRWIARERIDPPGGPAFDMEEIAELLRRLGPGPFCASEIPRTCRSDRGGLLRLSPIKDLGGGRVSVVVAYESRAPYSPAIVTRQMFVLGQEGDSWRILRRETPAR